ncbi:MAG TPA: hypothetical protein VN442_13915 [Bryobacteraceae bacterium]|nr:hypothetical protein [Bryobacteraceae bacterium]HWR36734.1 hypothetical protein [Clostridia bacterium]
MFGQSESLPWNGPATIAKVYLGGPPIWPTPDLDAKKEVAEVEAELRKVELKNAHLVRFIGGDLLRAPEEVQPWLARMGDVDGVLMIPISAPTRAQRALIDQLKVPALLFSRPYATHSWSEIAPLRKTGKKLDVLASSSYGDLDPYMRMFRTVRHLRRSKVLVGAVNPAITPPEVDAYSKQFGTTFKVVDPAEFRDCFEAVDERKAQKEADEFARGALRVVEATPEELRDGLRFYLGLANMLKAEQANALTIDCMGMTPPKTLPAYPCIAWSKFNDMGLYGVCEGHIPCTMTHLLVTSYAEVPGFFAEQVFDTSANEVIHANCNSATKMKGLHGPSYPYILRNNVESKAGAVLQVLMPVGETVTIGRFNGPTSFLASTAEVTGLVDSDRGCRNKIRTRVSDAQKWLQSFPGVLHRVLFYGNHLKAIEGMGRLMGFEVVREV